MVHYLPGHLPETYDKERGFSKKEGSLERETLKVPATGVVGVDPLK